MSNLSDTGVRETLTATIELAVEALGFGAGLVFSVDGSGQGLRGEMAVGVDGSTALLAPGRVGSELIGRAVSGAATSSDLAAAFAPERAAAAHHHGFSFALVVPLGQPVAAIVCLVAGTAPPANVLEQVQRLLVKVGAALDAVPDDQHRVLLESMHQCVCQIDTEGRKMYLNPAWTRLTGHSVELSLGKHFSDFMHPDERDAASERLRALLAGEKSDIRPVVRYRFADGRYHWVEILAHALTDADGKVVGAVAVLFDAAERETAFETLRASEANLRRLLELLPEPILFHDGHNIVYANPALVRACGRPPGESLVGTSILDLVVPADKLLAAAEGPPSDLVVSLHRLDGVEVMLEIISVPLSRKRGPIVMILGRDVTARMRSEEALRRAKDNAERTARTRSEFLANISHELRTPIHGILGMTELTLTSQLDEEQRGQLRTVHECAGGLLRIIDDILDFSRTETGKIELTLAPFELWSILGEVVRPLAAAAAQKGLELVCHVDRDVPTHLVGDGGRLRQLLFYLVGNAIKFSHQGEIVVEVSRQGGTDHEVALSVRVVDQGIGIPLEKQAAIFDAFEQGDGAATRRFGGVGLGLALCQHLVSAMGGHIGVESTPGKGSTFQVTTTLGVVPVPPPPVGAFVGSALVVAESARVRAALVAMLGEGAADTPSVDAALRAIWVKRPGLVVLEASLTGAHDVEAAARRSGARLVLLVAPGAARPERMGAGSGRVVKPALAPALHAALIGATPSAVVDPVRTRSLGILLAEDNDINRRLMVRHLERLGHKVTAVENGRVALAALGKQSFELILMDVQMPELDGLTTTRIIRAREAQLGGHVPIVALTAHALGEHRDQCLAAGMDDYLVKPLPMEKLHAILARLAGAPRAAADTPVVGQPIVTAAFDLDRLRAMVGDDPEAIPELAGLFVDEVPRHKNDLRSALAAGDVPAVGKAAHKAKASFLAVSAAEGGKLAGTVEALARAGSSVGALAAPMAALERALDQVGRALAAHVLPAAIGK